MSEHSTEHPITSILSRWPSRKALAEDMGRPVVVIHRWHQRRSIPAEYDARLLDAAASRNIPLDLREIAAARDGRDHAGHGYLDKSSGSAA